MDFTHTLQITKINPELQIVWGWAYVTEEDGETVVDHSAQIIETMEAQKMAHGFVSKSRVGGVMHESKGGEIVDSIFLTKEIQEAMNVDAKKVGWFIGYHVKDKATWERVKSGELSAFSIAGTATEEVIDDAA